MLEKNVTEDLGSDNTDSALLAAPAISMMTGEKIGEWPCAIHINALDLKNALEHAFGKIGGYDDAHPIMIMRKYERV